MKAKVHKENVFLKCMKIAFLFIFYFIETDERWAWPSNNQTQETGGATPPTPPMPYYYGMYRQDQPMFYDPRPQPSLGIFLPKPNKTAPVALGNFFNLKKDRYRAVVYPTTVVVI